MISRLGTVSSQVASGNSPQFASPALLQNPSFFSYFNKLLQIDRVLHNHPSGDPSPSHADVTMTRQVAEAGKVLGIAVHDHLVVGAQGVASFKALGLF